MEILIFILLVVVFDIAALRWGYDSTEKIDSPKWERRATWHELEDSDASRRGKPLKACREQFSVG